MSREIGKAARQKAAVSVGQTGSLILEMSNSLPVDGELYGYFDGNPHGSAERYTCSPPSETRFLKEQIVKLRKITLGLGRARSEAAMQVGFSVYNCSADLLKPSKPLLKHSKRWFRRRTTGSGMNPD